MVELARMLLAGLGPLLTLVLPVAFLVGLIELTRSSRAPARHAAAGKPPAAFLPPAAATALLSELELPPLISELGRMELEQPRDLGLLAARELTPPPEPEQEAVASPASLLSALYRVAELDLPNPARLRGTSGGTGGIDELVDRVSVRLLNRTLAEHGFSPGTRIWEQALPAARLAALFAANPDRADWN
jgi:hypothetical protein